MHKVTIFDVANYFLSRVEVDAGSVITHLKLQKLCYYAQAWHLVFEDEPMFSQKFEAWAHGPVCPALWNKYKEFAFYPIYTTDELDSSKFTTEQLETLEAVWDAYGHYDAKYLEQLTHQEDPWIEARGSCPPGDKCKNKLSQKTMRDYYTAIQESG